MEHEETVCAVVVTFNRKKLLIECLESLENQSKPLNGIYIVDNASTDGTPQLLYERGYITELPSRELENSWEKISSKNELQINYVRMCENTGGAGGFHEGLKRAYKKGYDWLWLMDDDSEPERDSLITLSDYFNLKDIKALCGIVKDPKGKIEDHRGFINSKMIDPLIVPLEHEEYTKGIINVEFASFVGLMINRRIVEQIGYTKKEFFIHYDDFEYCIRLREKTKILLVNSSIIIHKDAYLNERIPDRGQFNYDNLWIFYFGIRNLVWIKNKYKKNNFYFYFSLITRYLFNLVEIILFGNHKFIRIRLTTEAYLDGYRSVFDNNKPKRILYEF